VQHFVAVLALASLAVATATGLVLATRRPAAEPLADFDHALHAENDLACVDCHVGVETAAAAGVPSVTFCAECHEDPEDGMTRTENGKRILDHILRGEEVWWHQLYWLPDHVVFSHRRHFAIGEVPCDVCHGDIGSSTTLPGEPVFTTLTMDGCMECHERSGATLDCVACHR
jgi:hypothetical protein